MLFAELADKGNEKGFKRGKVLKEKVDWIQVVLEQVDI